MQLPVEVLGRPSVALLLTSLISRATLLRVDAGRTVSQKRTLQNI